MKKLNGFQLKLFMALLMVLDHIEFFIPSNISALFHVLTRCVAVWFGYMAVEGFLHTSSLKKYLIRLFTWAGIMFAGNQLLTYLFKSKNIALYHNIFLTMALGVLILTVFTKVSNKFLKYSLIIGLSLFSFTFSEGGFVVIPFILITYIFRNNTKLRNIIYIALSVFLFSQDLVIYNSFETTLKMFAYNANSMFILVIPFIYVYNGKRGSNSKFAKYFFYIFYPAHLWIIAALTFLM